MKTKLVSLLLMVLVIAPMSMEASGQQNTQQPQIVYVTSQTGLDNQVYQTIPETKEPTRLEKYYSKSGTSFLSLISVGYSTFFLLPNNPAGYPSTEFAGKRHLVNVELFEWRAKLVGMQLFNFEIGLNSTCTTKNNVNLTTFMCGGPGAEYGKGLVPASTYKDMWIAYKPALKFYIPCSSWMAIELYGGVEVEITKVWDKIMPKYYEDKNIPAQNYFLGAYGGIGLMFSAVPAMPVEIKAEYRHNLQGNPDIIPQGIYVSAQLHLGAPIRKK